MHNVESVEISPSNILYASTYDDGFYKSTDFGKSWILTNMTAGSLFSTYTILVLHDETVLVATEDDLKRSSNFGESWSDLPVNTSYYYRGICINNNNDIWTIGWGGQTSILYRSTDNGITFNEIYPGILWTNNNSISALGDLIIVTNYNIHEGGFYISTDNGNSWSDTVINTVDRCVLVQPNGNILIGGSPGILVSKDKGESWTSIPFVSNQVVEIEEDMNGKLFFGTDNKGLYEVDLITSVDQNTLSFPEDYKLYQNYPNPFNSSTIIKYYLPKESNIKLRFFNLLGEQILAENLGFQKAGVYEYMFNINNLPSGIYIYKLEANEFSFENKMILIK